MTLLSRHIKRIGFFRPIIRVRDEKDHDIDLVSKLDSPVINLMLIISSPGFK
jgi:hypothetical protein